MTICTYGQHPIPAGEVPSDLNGEPICQSCARELAGLSPTVLPAAQDKLHKAASRRQAAGQQGRSQRSPGASGTYEKEADLKLTVRDYLDVLMKQGKLWYDRLNSGTLIIGEGKSRRCVKMCREGTADFEVIQGVILKGEYRLWPQITFIETKCKDGKQRPDQVEFQRVVEAQGARYVLARTLEDVQQALR